MQKKVSLWEIVDAMTVYTDQVEHYLEKETSIVHIIMEEDYSPDEDIAEEDFADWREEPALVAKKILEDEELDENERAFIPLPDSFDANEYQIIENFIDSIEDDRIATDLAKAIKGKGAFSRFKEDIHYHGVQEDWYNFREQELKDIAIDWCEAMGLEYIDDMDKYKQDKPE